ncbi:MAG: hypothetical protein WD941_06295 [Opitutus sp.]
MTNENLLAVIKKNPIGVACGALAIGLVVAIYFRSGGIPEAEAELAQRLAEADKYAANITYSVSLKEQHDALVDAVKEIDVRLVRASQLGINNQYFFKLESDTGVKMIDFRQGQIAAVRGPKGAYSPVPFSVSVQGDMVQVVNYLNLIESGTHYCRVISASLTPVGATRPGFLSMSLNLELLGLP